MVKELNIILGINKEEKTLYTAELMYDKYIEEFKVRLDGHSFTNYFEDPSEEIEKIRDNYLDNYPVDFSKCYTLGEVKDEIRMIEGNFCYQNGFFDLIDCSCSGNAVIRVDSVDYALLSNGCNIHNYEDLIKNDSFMFIHESVKKGFLGFIDKFNKSLINSEEDFKKYSEEIFSLFEEDDVKFACYGGHVCYECRESLGEVLTKIEEESDYTFMNSILEPTPYLD